MLQSDWSFSKKTLREDVDFSNITREALHMHSKYTYNTIFA